MKSFFSFCLFALSAMALGQQNVLFLELSADGAGDEAVVLVDIATEPALSDAPMTVTLMGDEEVTLTIALPDGTMQGVVTASAMDCAGNFIEEEAFMVLSNEIDTAGVFILEAEIELPYCEEDDEDGDDDEDDDEEGFDEFEDLDLDELTAYLDSLCSDAMGNDAWMYCGLLESLNACLDGDEAACEELEEWLEVVDGPWNEEDDDEEDDDEEEDDEEGNDEDDCEADFVVVQAFDADSNAIANELFVFVFGLDLNNDIFWSFGDEGSSTDPFPTWEYETNGPYELCLTVGNEEEDCSDTYCFTLSLDSLGWLGGIQDGFSITVLDGGQGSVADVDGLDLNQESLTLFPNPSIGGVAQLEWHALNAGQADVKVFDLTGRQLLNDQINVVQGTQRMALQVNAKPGIHLVQITQGEVQRTLKWLVK
ncbi:MAG: T9SS type A sorting domain-containing protein [Flavobacteriales bacterium]